MGWKTWVQIRAEEDFSLLHSICTCFAARTASYPMNTWGSIPMDKMHGRKANPQTSIYNQCQE
jgi:hypothetical protein